jgi:transposase
LRYQQDIQSLHRIRERSVRSRTRLINQTRGLLAEYGIVSQRSEKGFILGVQAGMNDDSLSMLFKQELEYALDELQRIYDHVARTEAQLRDYVEKNEDCKI